MFFLFFKHLCKCLVYLPIVITSLIFSLIITDDNFSCSITLSLPSSSISPKTKILFLYNLDEPKYHEDTKEAQDNTVQLNKQETILYGITTTTTSITTTARPATTTPPGGVSINATWTFDSENNATNITIIVRNLAEEQYAAVGLGQSQSMV